MPLRLSKQEQENFVATWNGANSVHEVCQKMNMFRIRVVMIAQKLRLRGYKLKALW